MLSDDLVAILVCPKSKERLLYFPRGEADRDESEGFLVSPASRLRYRIENGVPVLLSEEASECRPDEIERLVARARELGLPGAE